MRGEGTGMGAGGKKGKAGKGGAGLPYHIVKFCRQQPGTLEKLLHF